MRKNRPYIEMFGSPNELEDLRKHLSELDEYADYSQMFTKRLVDLLVEIDSVNGHSNTPIFDDDLNDRLSDVIREGLGLDEEPIVFEDEKKTIEVFSREECVFMYCPNSTPNSNLCKDKCMYPNKS